MERLSNNQKNKIAQYIFLVAFTGEILIRCLNSLAIQIPYRTRLLQLMAVIFGVKILLTKYSKKEWFIIVGVGLLTVLSFVTTRDTLWIEIAMMLIASKDVDRKKCLQIYLGMLSVTMILMALLSGLGIHGEFVQIKDFDRGGIEARYCFGFSHPNVFYSNLLILLSTGLCIFNRKLEGWHFIVLTVLNCFFMDLSASRTGFIVVQVLIAAMYIVKKWPKIVESKVVYVLGYVSIALAAFLSYIVYFIDWEVLAPINHILTGRLGLAIMDAPIVEWTLLPVARESVVVDMGFVNVMYHWGVILGVIYLYLIFWN